MPIMPFDSAAAPPAAAIPGTDATGMHDPRQENDDLSASTYVDGATILSSCPSSPPRSLRDDRADGDGTEVHRMAASLWLSLNPSMVGSSMLVPSEAGAAGDWAELNRPALSLSSVSTCTGASDASDPATSRSTPGYAPGVCVAIGQSLLLASSASSDAHLRESARDALSNSSAESAKGTDGSWWGRLQTDKDWDDFRTRANDYLSALIAEEMKELKRDEQGSGNSPGADAAAITEETARQRNNEGFSGLIKQWLGLQFFTPVQVLYESIHAAIGGITSNNDSTDKEYFSSLIEEIVHVQQQLGRLPPIPPTLPLDDMSLGDLPSTSRAMLAQHNATLDEWKEMVIPRQEELLAKYVQCQEKLLAAIIDEEERTFHANNDECNALGSDNDDGYIEVVGKHSMAWDDVNEALAATESKCRLTMGTVLVAALATGASFLMALQSQRK